MLASSRCSRLLAGALRNVPVPILALSCFSACCWRTPAARPLLALLLQANSAIVWFNRLYVAGQKDIHAELCQACASYNHMACACAAWQKGASVPYVARRALCCVWQYGGGE
jgi:hypothetical protein